MQNDSLNALNAIPDSTQTENLTGETPVQIGISVHTDSLPNVMKGDTFEFKVNVSFEDPTNQSAVLIVPVSSANAKGITQLGVREEHSRVVQNGKSVSNNQFIYTLVADDTGSVSIPALHFQIPSKNGPFEFSSESVALNISEPSHTGVLIGFGVIGFVLVALSILAVLRKKKRYRTRKKAEKAARDAFAEEFAQLKARVAKADSRAWLLDLEKICKSWAEKNFGSDNLEELAKAKKLEGWDALLEEFAHARYGGGARDAFENKESWKLAKKLMHIEIDE